MESSDSFEIYMAHPLVLKKQTILNTQLFSVQKLTLKNPKKESYVHYNVIREPTVCVFPISDSKELYLISQYRYIFSKVILEEVAGYVDKGESPLSAAKRELMEETGISAKSWRKISTVYLTASTIYSPLHIFVAEGLSFGKQNLQDDEQITVCKMSIGEAFKKVLSGEIFTAGTVTGILMLKAMQIKNP